MACALVAALLLAAGGPHARADAPAESGPAAATHQAAEHTPHDAPDHHHNPQTAGHCGPSLCWGAPLVAPASVIPARQEVVRRRMQAGQIPSALVLDGEPPVPRRG